jgi:ATP-dependent DNA helicase UvrD/PcrA
MDLHNLNEFQREAVTADDGSQLVVAGAGSGKTRVLTTRIAWLLEQKRAWPSEILAFTFTNKAAREMRERVEKETGSNSPRWIGTFHATGLKILRRDGAAEGVDPSFSIYDTDDSTRLIKRVLSELNMDPKQYPPRSLRSVFSKWKNEDIDPAQAVREADDIRAENLAKAFKGYEDALRRSNALDFDDLILRTVHLLENHPEIRERYAKRYRYVLVDEFQDTNELQLLLIKALSSHHGNVFAVGDDDQSIYSWRGACIENMLNFEDYFQNTSVVRLEQNYRSSGNILSAANAVIANNSRRRGKNLWTDGENGDPISIETIGDEEDEAARLVEIVRERIRAGGQRGDVTVLYRTNAQSRVLEDALRRANMPYQIVGSTAFYERKEIRDILAYLKLVNNPSDGIAVNRVINVPKRRIGKATIDRLNELAAQHELTLRQVADRTDLLGEAVSSAAAKRIIDFFALTDRWRQAAETLSVPDLLIRIMEEIAYDVHLQADDPETASGRTENVMELVNAAYAFDESADNGTLAQFLEQTALVADADTINDDQGVVKLMTVHAAKGLEFPVVVICGVDDNLMPHISNHDDHDSTEEERRLFYVAMTRAETRLHLLYARMRRKFGQREYCEPSRFLKEIPEEIAEFKGDLIQPSTLQSYLGGETSGGLGRSQQTRAAYSGRQAKAFSVGDWQKDVSQQQEAWYAGQQVMHAQHGCGTIVRVEGSGEDLKLSIDFPGGERKHFLAKFAKLKPI